MLKVNTKVFFFYVELLLSKTYFVVFKKGVKDGIIWLLRFAVKYVELEDKWNKINHGVFILEALWYLPEGSLDNVLSFLHISTVLLSKVASRKWKFKTEGSPPCERQSPTISTIERKEMFFTQENWKCVRVIQGISTSPIKRSSLQGFTLLSSILLDVSVISEKSALGNNTRLCQRMPIGTCAVFISSEVLSISSHVSEQNLKPSFSGHVPSATTPIVV